MIHQHQHQWIGYKCFENSIFFAYVIRLLASNEESIIYGTRETQHHVYVKYIESDEKRLDMTKLFGLDFKSISKSRVADTKNQTKNHDNTVGTNGCKATFNSMSTEIVRI